MFCKWHFMGQRSMRQGIRGWVHQGSQPLPPLCLPRMGAQLPTALLRCSDHTCPHSMRGPGHRHPGGSHTPCVPSHQARPLATVGYCIHPTSIPMIQRISKSHSVVSGSLQPQGLYSPWNSPGHNTGVGSCSLFQGDLPNAGLEPRSPTLQADSLPVEPQGKPKNTGVGSLSLLQWIFTTQELNWGLLNCRQILYQLSYEASPWPREHDIK